MSIRTCQSCRKTETYDPDSGWMWYGSLRDWEENQDLIIFTCSDSCREALVKAYKVPHGEPIFNNSHRKIGTGP